MGEQQQQHHDDIGCAVRKGQSIRQAGRQACMRAKCACTTQHRPPPPPPPLSAVSVWSIPQKERYYCWGQATKCSCAAVFAPQQRPSPPPSRNATHTHTHTPHGRGYALGVRTHTPPGHPWQAASVEDISRQREREREVAQQQSRACMQQQPAPAGVAAEAAHASSIITRNPPKPLLPGALAAV